MLPHECREYVHYGGLVPGGVPGHALQGVNAADPHVELLGADLLDRLGVAVGHLSFLGEFERAPLPSIGLFGVGPQEAEVQGGEYQRARREYSRSECQQLRSRGLPRRLQVRCALSTCYQAHVVRGDQVSNRPEQRDNDCHRYDRKGDCRQ